MKFLLINSNLGLTTVTSLVIKSEADIMNAVSNVCQGSQGGHGACLKNMRLQFDSVPWHKSH